MAFSTFSKLFKRLSLLNKEMNVARLSTQGSELPLKFNPLFLQPLQSTTKLVEKHVSLTVGSLTFHYHGPRSDMPISKIIDCPMVPSFQIDEPLKNEIIIKSDIIPDKVVEVPSTNIIEKRAERLIVIRRKKMKKHKRRKFLKRMKYVIMKRKQKKELLREKVYQAELQEVIAKAEKFDPKEYVTEKLNILTRTRLPTKWRGEALPESMILQFMKEKKDKKDYKQRLLNYRLKLD